MRTNTRPLRLRLAVLLTPAVLVGGVGAVGAGADHLPVDETPDYNVVDGTPICGVEGAGYEPAAPLEGTVPAVGTYNILHAQAENDDADVTDRQAQVIDALIEGGADAWGLQEVTNDAEHGNQAQELAAALAEHYQEPWEWCWSMSNARFPGEPDVLPGGGGPLSMLAAQFSKLPEGDLSGFKEGLAVITRYEITEAKFRRLQPRAHEAAACPIGNPIDCQFPAVFDSRQVLHTEIGAGFTVFDVFNTHIAHGLTNHSDGTKKAHIEKALDAIEEWAVQPGPHFFVGDFNSDYEGNADRIQLVLDEGFLDSYGESSATECRTATDTTLGCTAGVDVLTSGPAQAANVLDARIDYVFARNLQPACGDLTVTGSKIIGTNAEFVPELGQWRWPSDHLGVVSTFACA